MATSIHKASFDVSTDSWFDDLADHAEKQSYPAIQALLHNVKMFPSHKRLEVVRNFVKLLKPLPLRIAITKTIDDLETGKFRKEFRFTYHCYPTHSSMCSACGVLFSQLWQAIEYHKPYERYTP